MKKIYLARHGESVSNVSSVVQGAHDELTPQGQLQATVLADRVKHLDFQNLLVSDYIRTQETAKPLLGHTTVEPQYLALLREARRPTSLIGTSLHSDAFMHYDALATEHMSDPDWHFEDEENFYDIVARVQSFFSYVDTLEGNTLVVSHGRFIVYIVMYVLLAGKLSPEVWNTDFATFTTTNTGITVLSYKENKNVWALTTYNDHAHFAE